MRQCEYLVRRVLSLLKNVYLSRLLLSVLLSTVFVKFWILYILNVNKVPIDLVRNIYVLELAPPTADILEDQ